ERRPRAAASSGVGRGGLGASFGGAREDRAARREPRPENRRQDRVDRGLRRHDGVSARRDGGHSRWTRRMRLAHQRARQAQLSGRSAGRGESMIVDAHAYCFPPLDQANGFPSSQAHLRYLQRMIAGHRQAPWRLRDHALGDNSALADPQDRTLRGLREANFRAGGYGRFVWTVDGEDYVKQYLPPYLTDLSAPPELMIAQMDYVGVDRAVLHANPIMGLLNDYLAGCVRKYPNRLLGLAAVPEWQIRTKPERLVEEVGRAYADGLHGLQFITDSRYRHGLTASWDADACRPFWDGVVALGKPVLFTLHTWPTLPEYFEQLRIW